MSRRLLNVARSSLTVSAVFVTGACDGRITNPADDSRPAASSRPRPAAGAHDEEPPRAVLNDLHRHDPETNVRAPQPRTDLDIAEAILDAARADRRLEGARFTPNVTDGVVTLNGHVDTLSARMTAAAVARNTVGVRAVKNHLTVTPPRPFEDQLQQRQISDALRFDTLLTDDEIKPAVANGRVTLAGSVDTYFERAEALDDVSGIANITAIDDDLTVRLPAQSYVYAPWVDPFTPHVDTWYATSLRPGLSDSEITKRIHENFKWSAFVQPLDVRVKVDRGQATLTGRVSGYRLRQAAIDAALEAGAVSVDDELIVG